MANIRKAIKVTIYCAISIAFGLFLILTGVKDQKITFAQTQPETSDKAVVILVDNSGSMGRCSKRDSQGKCLLDAEKPYRVESVKEVVRQSISQGSFSSSKIGLVEFGDWESYGLSYEKRCEGVKPRVPPITDGQGKVVEALKEINANHNGVTPIAYAINLILNDILREGDLFPAKIVLFTDGHSNCIKEYKYNLCDLVAGLAARNVDLEIYIFGYKYKVKDKDNEFMNCAKQYPGMVKYFGSSDNPSDLKLKVEQAFPHSSSRMKSWACFFRNLDVLLYIIVVLCIVLVVAIIASLALPGSTGWVGIALLRLVPSDPIRLGLLIAAFSALGILAGIVINGLKELPCN